MPGILLVKIGGRSAEDERAVSALADELKRRKNAGDKVILVHGGGSAISGLQERYGVKPRFIDGLRQTRPEEMPLVDMALAGAMNKKLVRLLGSRGLPAWGVSGADAGILTAISVAGDPEDGSPEENRTGRVDAVDSDPIRRIWDGGYVPVFAPPAADSEGRGMNVNADEAALALAKALKAESLVFLSDVPGVLENGEAIPRLTPASVEEKIAEGVIDGGMIPKTRSAVAALREGVGAVIIGDYSETGDLAGLLAGRRGTRIEIEEEP